jgi:hypothetical protein
LSEDLSTLPPGTQAFREFKIRQHTESALHQVEIRGLYNHPKGFFAQVYGLWNAQSNEGYSPDNPGDDFWQLNIFAGYRFPSRRAQITIGLLNVTDQDYRLNPLVPYHELPRERTFLAKFDFNF